MFNGIGSPNEILLFYSGQEFKIMVCKPCPMSYKSDSSYSKSVSIKLVCVLLHTKPSACISGMHHI